jgi:hypothetical protein
MRNRNNQRDEKGHSGTVFHDVCLQDPAAAVGGDAARAGDDRTAGAALPTPRRKLRLTVLASPLVASSAGTRACRARKGFRCRVCSLTRPALLHVILVFASRLLADCHCVKGGVTVTKLRRGVETSFYL